jgi:hypothetical protein
VVPKDEKNVSTYHGTPRDTGRVRIPALSVFGGYGPEGSWPFVEVMRPRRGELSGLFSTWKSVTSPSICQQY